MEWHDRPVAAGNWSYRPDGGGTVALYGIAGAAPLLTVFLVIGLGTAVGQIPLGLAVCLVGLGLVERDGLVVLGGLVIGMFGVAINAGFAYAVIAATGRTLRAPVSGGMVLRSKQEPDRCPSPTHTPSPSASPPP